jgi:hypothetical protein
MVIKDVELAQVGMNKACPVIQQGDIMSQSIIDAPGFFYGQMHLF